MTNTEASSSQMAALGAMPVTLTSGPNVLNGCLPVGAPHGGTIKALRDRGWIERRDNQWVRTPLGDELWSTTARIHRHPRGGLMTRDSEEVYARHVALGLLRAHRLLVDARDLLYSIEHPLADKLAEAVKLAAEVERDLGEETVDGQPPLSPQPGSSPS